MLSPSRTLAAVTVALALASGCTSTRTLIARGDHYAACRRAGTNVHTPELARSLRRALGLRLQVHAPTRAELQALLGATAAARAGQRLLLVGARLDARAYNRPGVRVTLRYALELWQGARIVVAHAHDLGTLALITGELRTPFRVETRSKWHLGALARNLARVALLPLSIFTGRLPQFEQVHSRLTEISAKRVAGAELASALHAVLSRSCRARPTAVPAHQRSLCLVDTRALERRAALTLALRVHYTLHGPAGRCRVFDDVVTWSVPAGRGGLAERVNRVFANQPRAL